MKPHARKITLSRKFIFTIFSAIGGVVITGYFCMVRNVLTHNCHMGIRYEEIPSRLSSKRGVGRRDRFQDRTRTNPRESISSRAGLDSVTRDLRKFAWDLGYVS